MNKLNIFTLFFSLIHCFSPLHILSPAVSVPTRPLSVSLAPCPPFPAVSSWMFTARDWICCSAHGYWSPGRAKPIGAPAVSWSMNI